MTSSEPFRRLLVANRGEIAVRIIQAARELSPPIEVYAIYTEDDTSHCDTAHPDHALLIPSVATYLDSPFLVRLAQDNAIDAIHPGYGFLSESADFAARMQDAGITVIGPGSSVLSRTGDKLQAKQLAVECDVPVLPAMAQPTADVAEVRAFVKQVQYPVMVKASPSGMVFVEKAAVKGFRHVEVQIIGDGVEVRHLWERDCSVQRRFQKVVEMAPSLIGDRGLVQRVVDAAVRMGRATRYRSLGTVEFLVNEGSGEFYFLEINPRIQVEHTVTEELMRVDLVQAQLKLAMGYTFAQLGLGDVGLDTPKACAIQLRLCAEDPSNQFALSVGKVTEMVVPSGRGVRVDTHIRAAGANPVVVGAQLDNLLAKIIVTASTWEGAVLKARRVLADTTVAGVRTNLELLRGVVAQEDFLSGRIDTQWLESSLDQVLQQGASVSRSVRTQGPVQGQRPTALPSVPSSNLLFRRGDAWSIRLTPVEASQQSQQHRLQLTRVLRNDFPTSLAADIEYQTPSSSGAYRLELAATSTTASALFSSAHRRGDLSNPRHIVLPLSGKLIEVLVSSGDHVAENQVIAFIKQMKMEVEVRSPRAGQAQWVYEMEDEEEDVAEGMLLVELTDGLQGKL
ncbi:hypothetical protein CAN33_0012935 [Aspergillus niger]|uniref:Pyruvate carboxylase n=1 Tax=Aspergillus niger TaxID=5061 RepID=A0A505HQQ1_ASPNG|nr:hypothetical protein CAN33_0012935 [Aspergillus niger]